MNKANRMPLFDIWVVYDHPIDYPELFVARKWVHAPEAIDYTPTMNIMVSPDLDVLRTALASRGCTVTDRMANDEPQILEVWLG